MRKKRHGDMGIVEVTIQIFIIWTLYGGERSVTHCDQFNPRFKSIWQPLFTKENGYQNRYCCCWEEKAAAIVGDLTSILQ
jgi:hypothetical protein